MKGKKSRFVLFLFLCFAVIIICAVIFPNFVKDLGSRVITGNNIAKLEHPKQSFNRTEIPTFTVSIPTKTNTEVGKTKDDVWTEEAEHLEVKLVNNSDGSTVRTSILKQAPGKFKITLSDPNAKFGDYKISVKAHESFIYSRDLSQDFSWGVLAINTNKSIYLPGETAKLGFGVLDERGNTLCNAKLTLTISDPVKNHTTLSTENGTIKRNPKCIDNYYSLEEDYKAQYKTGKKGTYYMNLTAETNNGIYTISDFFEVRDSVPFEVERTQFPSRIYPVDSYPVKLTIHANEDYAGKVYDLVPIDFQITNISGDGKVSRTKNSKMSLKDLTAALKDEAKHLGEQNYKVKYDPSDISHKVDKSPVEVEWNVDWKKGQTYTLTYNIYFPQVSPEYYLLGPFTVGDFKEVRNWQVASDATKCWDGGGANNNWNTQANWASDTNPTSTSNATFHGASCTAGTPDKDVTVNTDPSLTGSGGGITLSSNYAGTMTQSSAMTLTGTIGFVMAGGTFAGGSQSISTRLFNQTGGAFTSTSGTLTVGNGAAGSGNFTSSAGTFTHNSGSVVLYVKDGGASTATGSVTFYNLAFDSDNCCNGVSWSIANGTTLTVNNTLTLENTGGGGRYDNRLIGSGGISAKGDITMLTTGWEGASLGAGATITVNGTGTQTITGVANGNIGSPGTQGQMPSLTINKTSGTLNLANNIAITGNFTYTQGFISPGTSKFIIDTESIRNPTVSITGTFNTYDFEVYYGDCCNAQTVTINSGTISSTHTLTWAGDAIANEMIFAGTGKFDVEGDFTISSGYVASFGASTFPIQFTGSSNQTITVSSSCCGKGPLAAGTWTINKPSGTVSLGGNLTLGQSGQNLTITNGILNMGSYNLTVNGTLTVTSGQLNQTTGTLSAGGISIGANGIWTSNSAGSIVIGSSGVSNSGYVHLSGGGPTCGNSSAGYTVNNAAFVQTNAVHDGAVSSTGLGFNNANTAGNLLVLTVVWDGSVTVSSVTDSRNTYHVAVGPTTGSFGKEETFYAYNIGAGSNSITINFSGPTTSYAIAYVDEYTGIITSDPYDNSAAATGTGSTMDSGSASITHAYDLIYGAGIAKAQAGAAGSGFTARNTNFGNIIEDKKSNATGSYNATAGNDGQDWIMQMVAFQAATITDSFIPILITSSSPGSARTWSGSGTYVLYNLDVSDQNGSLTAYNSLNRGSSSGWTFNNTCPAYSNRKMTAVSGGTKIQGGTTIRSN